MRTIVKSVVGPAVYVQLTGVPVVFGEGERIVSAEAYCSNGAVLAAVDTIYSLRTVINGQTVEVHPQQQTTVGGPGNAWGEIAGASNLAGMTFTVIAQIE